jgi:hypothetical protein
MPIRTAEGFDPFLVSKVKIELILTPDVQSLMKDGFLNNKSQSQLKGIERN